MVEGFQVLIRLFRSRFPPSIATDSTHHEAKKVTHMDDLFLLLWVENIGLEPITSTLPALRSSQMS